ISIAALFGIGVVVVHRVVDVGSRNSSMAGVYFRAEDVFAMRAPPIGHVEGFKILLIEPQRHLRRLIAKWILRSGDAEFVSRIDREIMEAVNFAFDIQIATG